MICVRTESVPGMTLDEQIDAAAADLAARWSRLVVEHSDECGYANISQHHSGRHLFDGAQPAPETLLEWAARQ